MKERLVNMLFSEIFQDLCNQHPLVLVDVGASGGAEPPWNTLNSNLEIIGFEPDIGAFNQLMSKEKDSSADSSKVKKKYLDTALYDKKTEVDFYLTKRQGHSSIFKPNEEIIRRFSFSERYDVPKTRKIVTNQLDDTLKNAGILDVDFMKLDTQGSELAILKGGERALSNCFGIEVEVEFLPLYQNQPLFSELEIFLRNFGFELFDIKRHFEKRVEYRDIYQAKGQLVCGDALFLKSCKRFIQDISTQNDEKIRAKILKSILVCYLYRLIDYALEITEKAFNRQYLTEREKEIITKKLRLDASGRNRYNKVIDFVKILANDFSKFMKGKKLRASYDDETLGNIRR